MSLFSTDLEALFYFAIIIAILYLINKIVSFIFNRREKIPVHQKIIAKFILRIVSVIVMAYLLIEGFPFFSTIDPTYTAVITGAISTAIAFASSGVFANLVSGIVLMVIRPFEVGDLVKIEGDIGVIREIKLTKIKMETFDNLYLEKSNGQILNSTIENCTVKLGRKKTFNDFKKKIEATQDKGYITLVDDLRERHDEELRQAYEKFSMKNYPNLYNFVFRMTFPYKKFQLIIDEVEELCDKYVQKNIFRLKPRYDIVDLGLKVTVKFRLMTFDINKIFDFQPQFARDVYTIINKNKD